MVFKAFWVCISSLQLLLKKKKIHPAENDTDLVSYTL